MKLWHALAALLFSGQALQAAGPVDPDWPCVQRRQPALSIAQLWPADPPSPEIEARAQDPDIDRLGQYIALRRTPMAEVEALLAQFDQAHPAADRTALFVASFTHLQAARNRVMSGITRYAHKQAALDRTINDQRQEFTTLAAQAEIDYDRLDALEAQLDWSMRIFTERQQSLLYVCETPVILEQRGFALGRLLAAPLPNPAP